MVANENIINDESPSCTTVAFLCNEKWMGCSEIAAVNGTHFPKTAESSNAGVTTSALDKHYENNIYLIRIFQQHQNHFQKPFRFSFCLVSLPKFLLW